MIRSVKPPIDEAAVSQIHAIQEAGWTRNQLRSSLSGTAARLRIALESPSKCVEDTRRVASGIQGFLLARRIADILEIDLVAVDRSMRRRGIGRCLLSGLIEEECRSGLAQTRLELAASNDSARALYEGLGFVVVGRRKRYYPDGDDALLLSLRNPPEIP